MKKELEIKIEIIECLIHNNENDIVTRYREIEQATGATRKEIKPIFKNLVDTGMTELVSAFDEEGFIRGSGYVLTTRATQWSIKEWLEELKKIRQEDLTK